MTREERCLWVACRNGHEWARSMLIDRHLHLVPATRRRVGRGFGEAMQEELEAEGRLALVQAVDRFDPKRGVRFSTFAIGLIRSAMLEWLRRDDWVPRSVRQRLRAGEEVQLLELVSLEAAREDEEESALLDRIADPYAEQEDRITARVCREAIARVARALPCPERAVIEDVYWRGATYAAIAEQIGRSESGAHLLHAAALARLRVWLAPWRAAYEER